MAQTNKAKNIIVFTPLTFALIMITSMFSYPVSAITADDLNKTVSDEVAYNNMEFTLMINLTLYAVGFVACIMLAYGCISFVKSRDRGFFSPLARAIYYAIFSIFLVLISYAINNFVVAG